MTVALTWSVVAAEKARIRGEQAGVLQRDMGTLTLLQASGPVSENLEVEGEVPCWHCRAPTSFAGLVFGRTGLGGVLRNTRCPRCRAVVEVCTALLSDEEGCGLFVYVPTTVRGKTEADHKRTLTLKKVLPVRPAATAPGREALRHMIADMAQAGRPGQDPAALTAAASKLLTAPLTPMQAGRIAKGLRDWLARENRLEVIALLGDALLCLRDPLAGTVLAPAIARGVQGVPHSSLDQPLLLDLAALSLTCGHLTGLEAVRGILSSEANTPTRARKFGESLQLVDLLALADQRELPASYDSTLGDSTWRDCYAVVPAYVDPPVAKGGSPVMGTLGRLLTQVTAPTGPTPEVFFRGLARHFEDEAVTVLHLRMLSEAAAQSDLALLASQAGRSGGDQAVVLVRGQLTVEESTEPGLLLVGPADEENRLHAWLKRQLAVVRYCIDREVHVIGTMTSTGEDWPITLNRIQEFRWVEL